MQGRLRRMMQKRSLSNKVITRWYRPPEIIMVEKNYNTAVDMWSLGCVLAEMISCTKQYRQIFKSADERFVFEGSSCYPLSPCK